MALTSTMYRFALELADIDRGVYESLDLRVARHPSEDEERVVVRVLARAIAHEDGLEFGAGLSDVEDPALWSRSLTGDIETWIDVGIPTAERLHRAAKRAQRVLVFTHKSEAALLNEWSRRSVHRAEEIDVIRLPLELVRGLAGNLARKATWYVTLQEGVCSVADGKRNVQGTIDRTSLADLLAAQA